MNHFEIVARAVARHGLHKMATLRLADEGLPAPTTWDMPEVGYTLGVKLAQDRLEHRAILTGLGSLYELTGGLGEKTAQDNLYLYFSRVKNASAVLSKTASINVQQDLAAHKVGFWHRCKLAAANNADGLHLGLCKIALQLFDSEAASGEKVAASYDEVLQFAASFACAAVVDDAIATQLKTAEISPNEALYLSSLNAQAAFNDLEVITRSEKTDALANG